MYFERNKKKSDFLTNHRWSKCLHCEANKFLKEFTSDMHLYTDQ